MSANVLLKIAEQVQRRIAFRKAALPERQLLAHCRLSREPRAFRKAFENGGLNVIAEIKFASPSQGTFKNAAGLTPVQVATDYLGNGATALSILTEEDNFGGGLRNLIEVRRAFPNALILMKDFVIDHYQLLEARHFGADAVLLIVALLGKERTAELKAQCAALGLSALVEVHDERELLLAEELNAELIGVNNRNLKTLEISLDVSRRLAKISNGNATLISESGIRSVTDLLAMRVAGYRGCLVGSSLMETGEPGRALCDLLGGKRVEA